MKCLVLFVIHLRIEPIPSLLSAPDIRPINKYYSVVLAAFLSGLFLNEDAVSNWRECGFYLFLAPGFCASFFDYLLSPGCAKPIRRAEVTLSRMLSHSAAGICRNASTTCGSR